MKKRAAWAQFVLIIASSILVVIAFVILVKNGALSDLGAYGNLFTNHAHNLELKGIDRNDRQFVVRSDSGRQLNSGDVVFEKIQITMHMKNGQSIIMSSNSGHYVKEHNRLDLAGDVHLQNDEGVKVVTKLAYIDLNKGTAHGNSPVHGEMVRNHKLSKIKANGFRIDENCQQIVLLGSPTVSACF